jgi:hypothetical protein
MRYHTALAVLFAALATAALGGDTPSPTGKKKVLVELYTSQGCDSCPPASEFLGTLAKLGYGPDRVVPVGFHVDYFNDPWKDPYSDPSFSRRELEYNDVQNRKDLYFTPMMMVDGRYPMLGSDRPQALAAIKKALAEPAAVSLGLAAEGTGKTRRVSVELKAQGETAVDRDLLVAVALVQGPIRTRVASGENAGKTLVEHAVVRSFRHQFTRLAATGAGSLSFTLALPDGTSAAQCRVVAFVQDRAKGVVYQAESLAWTSGRAER